jgi:hypothetical protein
MTNVVKDCLSEIFHANCIPALAARQRIEAKIKTPDLGPGFFFI